jgi:precorrin-6B methylase 2
MQEAYGIVAGLVFLTVISVATLILLLRAFTDDSDTKSTRSNADWRARRARHMANGERVWTVGDGTGATTAEPAGHAGQVQKGRTGASKAA